MEVNSKKTNKEREFTKEALHVLKFQNETHQVSQFPSSSTAPCSNLKNSQTFSRP